MDRIENIIPAVIKNIHQKQPDVHSKIQSIWHELENGKVARHTKVTQLKDGCLVVNVDSAARMFRLNLIKMKIEKRLAQEVPEVSKVYFKIGKVT